jgi:hypothetical protein
LRPLVLLLAALAAILLPVALGAPALGAQNRAGAFNPPDVTFAGTPSVESPCSRRDSNAPGGRIAVWCFVGDEEAAGLDAVEDAGDEGEQLVYRLHGGESAEYGHSWTTVDPGTLDNPRDALGLPDGNTAEYLSTAKVRDWTGVEPRSALPLGGNSGGAPELLFPDPEQQLNIISTEPFSP